MAAGAVYGNEWSKREWNENDRVKVNLVTVCYKDVFSDDVIVRHSLSGKPLLAAAKTLVKDLLAGDIENKERVKKELLEIIKAHQEYE